MKTEDYFFHLPEDLIAKRPLEKRDSSRLLVLHRTGEIEHRRFSDLPEYLHAGDMLVINNTKVFPARLTGYKPTGGKLEILLVNEVSKGTWNILTRERYSGNLRISDDFSAYISEGRTAEFDHHDNQADLMSLIWKAGKMPLPPYIKRQPDETDKKTYQTVYADVEGSIAAPTAGLHFTKELLDNLVSRSILVGTLTLHVGIGTFRPVKADDLREHKMDEEIFEIDPCLLAEIKRVRDSGKRIIAVGTTTTRAIEGFMSEKHRVFSSNGIIKGSTDIFIYEGFRFRVIDSLITNFHLPCSTPLMLTSALAGREKLLKAYQSAISSGYRFFSYGDAMLVL